jgi:transposase-like protein
VDGLQGDAETKRRLRAILSTISGEQSVEDACRAVGIRPAFFGELRTRALAGALAALEPKAPGRPRREIPQSPDDVAELLRELQELRREVQILRAQLDVTTALANVPPAAPGGSPRSKSQSGPFRPSRTAATTRRALS